MCWSISEICIQHFPSAFQAWDCHIYDSVFANGAALEMLCFNEGLFKWIKFSKGSVSLKVEDLKLYTSLSHIFIRYWLLASWNSKFFVGIFFLIYHLHQTWPFFLLQVTCFDFFRTSFQFEAIFKYIYLHVRLWYMLVIVAGNWMCGFFWCLVLPKNSHAAFFDVWFCRKLNVPSWF